MKTAYILPGFQEDGRTARYARLRATLKRAGYRVKHPRHTWKRTSLRAYTEKSIRMLRAEKEPPVVVGFSFGAVATLLAATRVPLRAAVCCGLSPVFSEDTAAFLREVFRGNPKLTMKQFRRVWGERNLTFCKTLHWRATGAAIKSPAHQLMGAKELPVMKKRARALARMAKSRYVQVPGAGHDISHPGFAKALAAVLPRR